MKKNSIRRKNTRTDRISLIMLGITAITTLFTMTACGEPQAENSKTESSQTENSKEESFKEESSQMESEEAVSTVASTPAADGTAGNIFAGAEEKLPEPYEGELTGLTIALPSKDLHTKKNSLYDRLVEEIETYTGMNITWEWYETASYEEQLKEWIQAGNVPDIILTSRTQEFLSAAEEGLFWEVGPLIDEYDNLAIIPEVCRVGGSYNGKMYGIPRKVSTAGDWGLTYRADWLEKLGLKEPTDWESFCDMLYAFTYNDPDGNGEDDTVGLVVDTDDTVWDVMETWFGVPNSWGVDENGDLIHKSRTAQYRTAYAAFRELYAKGLINNGSNGVEEFRQLEGENTYGWEALRSEYKNSHGGSTINWFYNVCGVWKDMVEEGMITLEDDIFALQTSVDTGYGELVYPLGGDGVGDMLAISTTRIKSEKQLKQALQFINDFCDDHILNFISNGWMGEHYELDENGYVTYIPGNINYVEFSTYGQGIAELGLGYTAPENKQEILSDWMDWIPWKKRRELLENNMKNCAINYGYQFLNEEEIRQTQELEELLLEAELQYITGEIDEAGFETALAAWMENGGEEMTSALNKKYHAAGF